MQCTIVSNDLIVYIAVAMLARDRPNLEMPGLEDDIFSEKKAY